MIKLLTFYFFYLLNAINQAVPLVSHGEGYRRHEESKRKAGQEERKRDRKDS